MQPWVLEYLVDPRTKERLELCDGETDSSGEIRAGTLRSASGSYKILDGIPRFVDHDYATGFGLQWNRHDRTQLDTSQHAHSEARFWGETGFDPQWLSDKVALDGGCGSGRFADIASKTGAKVIAIDLSSAVEAAHRNLRKRPNVCVIQADLLQLPIPTGVLDAAYTIGVIQHTPDPLGVLENICQLVKPGGQIGVSWYKKYWYTYLHQKYWLRPLLKQLDDQSLYKFVRWYVPKLLPISRAFSKIPGAYQVADRVLPVANRDEIRGLTPQEQQEWAILDTYDWYNPAYDKPQTWKAVENVLERQGYAHRRAPHRRRGLHGIRVESH